MLRVEKVRYNDGMKNAVMDIQVSTAAELPSLNDVVCGLKIQAGSIAQIIQADSPTFVTLDADGTWYPEQSDSSNSLNASLLSAPKNLGGEREEITEELDVTDKIEKSVLYPDEPELTEPKLTEKEQPEMKKSEPTEDDIDKISDELGLEPFPKPVEEKKAKATESEVTEDDELL